jgi:tRNA uridine 5-carboxymethylaminomethyl modification enzyme
MFTSRAEYRLALREDNADLRLTPVGRTLGVVDDARWRRFEVRREWLARESGRLTRVVVRPADVDAASPVGTLARDTTAYALLRRPDVRYRDVVALGRVGPSLELEALDAELAEPWIASLETEARYAGYVERQTTEIERQRRHATTPLPADIDYSAVRGLSNEIKEKLERIRPQDIGQAARISGVTPAAISLLLVHVKKLGRRIA